jgi:hypothetical protein
MYFTIKYNVFYKYIINATTTAINACKKLFDVGQREVFFFIYVSYLTRESTLYFLNVNKYWHDRKRWEKKASIVKFCYCRIYHKFVNFIILNLFKAVNENLVLCFYVAFWSCETVPKLMRQTTQKVNKHWHGRKVWEKESNTVKGAR